MAHVLIDRENVTRAKLQTLIMRAVQEVLNDPDFGLELTARAKKRLREAQKSKTQRTIPFEDIKKKYL